MNFESPILTKTFKKAMERKEFLDRFFNIFLTDYPILRPFFESVDMVHQKAETARALNFVMNNLEHPERLKAFFVSLGESHGSLGLLDLHFGWFAEALCKTFALTLEDEWSNEADGAWRQLIEAIKPHMLVGASRGTLRSPSLTDMTRKHQVEEPQAASCSLDEEDDVEELDTEVEVRADQDSAALDEFGAELAEADRDRGIDEHVYSDHGANGGTVDAKAEAQSFGEPSLSSEEHLTDGVTGDGVIPILAKKKPKDASLPAHLKLELPSPLKDRIRELVADALHQAIQDEIKSAVESELNALDTKKIGHIIKNAM